MYLVFNLSKGSAFPVLCRASKTVVIAWGDSFPEYKKQKQNSFEYNNTK